MCLGHLKGLEVFRSFYRCFGHFLVSGGISVIIKVLGVFRWYLVIFYV